MAAIHALQVWRCHCVSCETITKRTGEKIPTEEAATCWMAAIE